MNEFSPWTQGNWYALGNLLTQLGFLLAAVWFARNIIKAMRAFQEQIGALLKLSITAPPAERHSVAADASPYWLTPAEAPAAAPAEPVQSGPGRLTIAWHRVGHWLREPMKPSEILPLRRIIRWLQAPTGG